MEGTGGWILFNLFILALLALDLGVFHRQAREVKIREALAWSLVWILMALGFNVWVWWQHGPQLAKEFLTGYVIEKSLSVDNLFVFLVIFNYFEVPRAYQHRVLLWGVLGALVLRLVCILAATELLDRFHWLIYPMGGFLVLTGVRMLLADEEKETDLSKNLTVRFFRRWLPLSPHYEGERFFVRHEGRLLATPLLLVLLVIDVTDVVFAVDSIPAIVAVVPSKDSFIIYSSNAFAILGLRALYFALAALVDVFRFLNIGLAAVLMFIGGNMLVELAGDRYKLDTNVSLSVVLSLLALSVIVSLLVGPKPKESPEENGEALAEVEQRRVD